MQPLCLVFLFLCSTLLLQWSQGCHPHDRSTLLAFKAGITADPSGLLRSWDSAMDCCSAWDGVVRDTATGRVVNVSRPGLSSGPDFISDASIAGRLSPALGDLFSLRLLDLSNLKKLAGPIPPALGRLSNTSSSTPTNSSVASPPPSQTSSTPTILSILCLR